MITFLPFEDFGDCARTLDDRRLGKQRSEALVLVRTLVDGTGWLHHPAAQMWFGYTDALKAYHDAMIIEWMLRGFRNNMPLYRVPEWDKPNWLGEERLHASHRAVLLRKDYFFYKPYGWREVPGDSYYWPISDRRRDGSPARPYTLPDIASS